MKVIVAVCFLAMAAVALARPEEYTDKYDNVNLDEMLSSRRLLVPYMHCVMDQGKCPPDGKELKSHIKDALENNCAKCTKAQKDGTKKVIRHLIKNEPELWKELCDKYDPDRKYTAKYEAEFKA